MRLLPAYYDEGVGYWLAGALMASLVCPAADVAISLEGGAFRLSGAQAPSGGWDSVFAVYAGTSGVPAMLGSYEEKDRAVLFRPRFPLVPGLRYRSVYRGEVEQSFELPAASEATAALVTGVFPSASSWPANLLRFYVHFSRPMSRGAVWKHARLLDENGSDVNLAFLELEQELWNPEQTRLTILLDPGRVKRGLAPSRRAGAVLAEGRTYTLAIGKEMPDASGKPLGSEFRKSFRAGRFLRREIDLRQWKLRPPIAGSTLPLVVDFPYALDAALLEHALQVGGAAGTVRVAAGETQWSFTPAQAWRAGAYTLNADTSLEDPAGNRIGRAFETKSSGKTARARYQLRFEVK